MWGNVVGFVMIFISPIYFPVPRLPEWLAGPAQLSPYTHAANALAASLSGAAVAAQDVVVLTLLTVAGLVVGSLGMRWREE